MTGEYFPVRGKEKRGGEELVEYRCFQGLDMGEITRCMNRVFSDYPVPIRLTRRQVQGLFYVDGVDLELSWGAFSQGEMIGFIINARGIYQGEAAAFDMGTGVVPEHRGKGVFSGLFSRVLQALREKQVEKYYLEVLQQNERAMGAYRRKGFAVTREFGVFQSGQRPPRPGSRIHTADLSGFDWGSAAGCSRVNPSFEHSDFVVGLHPEEYSVAFHQESGGTDAYCVFAEGSGRIVQLGYENPEQLGEVIRWLLWQYETVTAKNIDRDCPVLLDLLPRLGFSETVRQFEMVKDLRRA